MTVVRLPWGPAYVDPLALDDYESMLAAQMATRPDDYRTVTTLQARVAAARAAQPMGEAGNRATFDARPHIAAPPSASSQGPNLGIGIALLAAAFLFGGRK